VSPIVNRFTAAAVCDGFNKPTFELMGQVEAGQRWGLGVFPDAPIQRRMGPHPAPPITISCGSRECSRRGPDSRSLPWPQSQHRDPSMTALKISPKLANGCSRTLRNCLSGNVITESPDLAETNHC
jgi:hypothetical protein